MNRTLRFAAVVIAASVVFAAAVAQSSRASTQEERFITQPEQWIPLSYTIQRTHDGVPTTREQVARYSDGSIGRFNEDGRTGNVLDLSVGRFFELQHGKWTSYPMRVQRFDGKPFMKLKRSSVRQIESNDPRVIAVSSLGEFTFYLFGATDDKGFATIYCPELNMLEVWQRVPARFKDSPDKSLELTIVNLALGEPTAPRQPPAGVDVTISNTPSGPGRAVWVAPANPPQ